MGEERTEETQGTVELPTTVAAALHQKPKSPKVVASVIFFVNPNSGGLKGALLLKELQAAAQMVELEEDRAVKITAFDISFWASTTTTPPWTALQEALQVKCDEEGGATMVPSVVIAAGGDGTFNWTMEILRNPQLRQNGLVHWPSRFAPLPLGTGNELANVMGWKTFLDNQASKNCCSCITRSGRKSKKLIIPDLKEYLRELLENEVVALDEWQVIEQSASTSKTTVHPMLCFVSVGMDAQIAYQCAQIRDEKAKWRSSTVLMIKANHAWYGFKKILSPHDSIAQRVELEVQFDEEDNDNNNNDNENPNRQEELTPVDIPKSLQNVQIFNIASGADGIDFWGGQQPSQPHEFSPNHPHAPSPNDGKLEVCGLKNIFPHMAAIKLQLTHAHRLGQTASAQIKVLRKVPVQVDGEPWMLQEGDTLVILPRPRGALEDASTEVHVVQGPEQTGLLCMAPKKSIQGQSAVERPPPSASRKKIQQFASACKHWSLHAKNTLLLGSKHRKQEGDTEWNPHSEPMLPTTTTDNTRGSLFHRTRSDFC